MKSFGQFLFYAVQVVLVFPCKTAECSCPVVMAPSFLHEFNNVMVNQRFAFISDFKKFCRKFQRGMNVYSEFFPISIRRGLYSKKGAHKLNNRVFLFQYNKPKCEQLPKAWIGLGRVAQVDNPIGSHHLLYPDRMYNIKKSRSENFILKSEVVISLKIVWRRMAFFSPTKDALKRPTFT